MFFIFLKKYITTNFRDEQCFTVKPSLKYIEGTPLGPFDRPCGSSPSQIKISRLVTMKRIVVERFDWYGRGNEGVVRN